MNSQNNILNSQYIMVPGLSGGSSWFSDLAGSLGVDRTKTIVLPGHFDGLEISPDIESEFEVLATLIAAEICMPSTCLILHSIASGVLPYLLSSIDGSKKNNLASIVLIEGNLTDEDCAWSCQLAPLNENELETYTARLGAISELTFRKNLVKSHPKDKISQWSLPIKNVSPEALGKLSREILSLVHGEKIQRSLSEYEGKLIYICGDRSKVEKSTALAIRLGAAIHVIPDAGHFPMLDAPDQLTSIFLAI